MGSQEGWAQSNGFCPNGLLPNEAASVTRVLDQERWSIAEERTAELIGCIKPNQPSEERRNAVACYVQQLIARCFSCQVFTFGSVPLKTYLPDGDIDLTAFCKNQNLKDSWANEVRDILESEEKSEDAEFRVKEVQYIQAEVKIIKCLVENIVVDISFNQLGGLCTLCFLEEIVVIMKVDRLINQNHLFKRSIILIKAWCYYESRILGAHHGLISTYALETLVLYIFHVFNSSFSGPLEVLYRFLEFFSKFDWENFCISLWGPVPICSLPEITADPPRKDGGELLLSKLFLNACNTVYSVLPGGQETNELPFISKHFNVMDPLRTNNNLGRSVSKGNFFRIRSAFAFGAQRLARLFECPRVNIIAEIDQFFLNTWDRHGKGHRPDACSSGLFVMRPLNLNRVCMSDKLGDPSSIRKLTSDGHESAVEVNSNGCESVPEVNSHTQSEKTCASLTSSVASDQNFQMPPNYSSYRNTLSVKERSGTPDNLGNEIHDRFQFTRTHSSPEVTNASSEILSRGRNRTSETIKGQTTFTRLGNNYRRKISGPEVSANNSGRSLTDDRLSSRQSSSHQRIDAAFGSNSSSNSSRIVSVSGVMGEDQTSASETMQMHHEEQNIENMMATSRVHSLNGYFQMPVNLASSHLPVPISPSTLASWEYAHRNSAGIVPTSIISSEPPWGLNLNYSQGLVSLPVSQYSSNHGTCTNSWEEIPEPVDDGVASEESYHRNSDRGLWSEQDADFLGGSHPKNGINQAQQLEEKKQFTSRARVDDDNGDCISLSTVDTEIAEKLVPGTVASSFMQTHQIPFGIVPVGSGSRQRTMDKNGVLPFAFYPTGPPVPFVTMLPLYSYPTERGQADAQTSHFDADEVLSNSHLSQSDQGLDLTEDIDHQKSFGGPNFSVDASEEHSSDILNGDFTSHWQNLQYGRLCQDPRNHGPLVCPSPMVVPPMYTQGNLPWEGPGRPLSMNADLFSQLMGYGPGSVPVSPVQSGSNGSPNAYQDYDDEVPRHRGGTGTYLPKPKVSSRERLSSNTRHMKETFGHSHKDNHADREGNWNKNSWQRLTSQGQAGNQVEKPNTRING
ncbi:hypothetical protein RJ639_041870 [Escallonia herrerae]|uniref:Polymerase nucleotidyl transferase domain-containing protein n=1 Tax=Escallonia herrerae TaxID=1293975 RepID=A0AA89B3J1_9ASTE|nr:hypothetical protein RJ639_041870 [Escallonia herrerae]